MRYFYRALWACMPAVLAPVAHAQALQGDFPSTHQRLQIIPRTPDGLPTDTVYGIHKGDDVSKLYGCKAAIAGAWRCGGGSIPDRDPDLHAYILRASPKTGICEIAATGRVFPIPKSEELIKKYGPPVRNVLPGQKVLQWWWAKPMANGLRSVEFFTPDDPADPDKYSTVVYMFDNYDECMKGLPQ